MKKRRVRPSGSAACERPLPCEVISFVPTVHVLIDTQKNAWGKALRRGVATKNLAFKLEIRADPENRGVHTFFPGDRQDRVGAIGHVQDHREFAGLCVFVVPVCVGVLSRSRTHRSSRDEDAHGQRCQPQSHGPTSVEMWSISSIATETSVTPALSPPFRHVRPSSPVLSFFARCAPVRGLSHPL